MAIAVDASTPAILNGSGTGSTLASNSFSPPANALLVAFNQYDSNGAHVASMADTAGLTWTKLISGATTSAYTDVWVADVGGTAPGSMTATATWSASVTRTGLGIGVLVLTGAAAAASQTGQVATATATTGAPSVTLASAVATSWIFASIAYKSATAVTIPAGQTATFHVSQEWNNSAVTKSGLIQGNTAPGNSNLTIKDTAPSTTWSIAGAEILAAAGGTTFTDTASGTLTLAGATTEALTGTNTATGVLTFTGAKTESAAFTQTATGTLTFTGAKTEGLAHADATAGTLLLAGTDTESSTHGFNDTGTGTLILSGAKTEAAAFTQTAAGTLTFSGAASDAHIDSDTASGTLLFSGAGSAAPPATGPVMPDFIVRHPQRPGSSPDHTKTDQPVD